MTSTRPRPSYGPAGVTDHSTMAAPSPAGAATAPLNLSQFTEQVASMQHAQHPGLDSVRHWERQWVTVPPGTGKTRVCAWVKSRTNDRATPYDAARFLYELPEEVKRRLEEEAAEAETAAPAAPSSASSLSSSSAAVRAVAGSSGDADDEKAAQDTGEGDGHESGEARSTESPVVADFNELSADVEEELDHEKEAAIAELEREHDPDVAEYHLIEKEAIKREQQHSKEHGGSSVGGDGAASVASTSMELDE